MIAEILSIGTELLMGQVLNTNAYFLARRLSGLGVTLYHQSAVGDNPRRLEDALRLALSRADVVITTGGLGPTADDITKRITAQLAGQPLTLRPEAEATLRERFARMGRTMTSNNLSQAMFTPDSLLLPNPHGTAPGAVVPMAEGKAVIHLPGPPNELEPMWLNHAETWLAARSGRALVSRYVRIFGMGESAVDERLSDLMAGGNPTLSPYCSTGEVLLRATASAATAGEAAALLDPLTEEIRRRLGEVVYAVEADDQGSLARCAVEAARARGWTVTTCESLTGGLIAATLVGVPGASAVVKGGLVTYQTVTKTMLADVPAEVIDRFDVVSAEVARAMAEGARARVQADVALSATGLAGPDGGTPDKPVGTVYVGVATPRGTRVLPLRLTGDRMRIRTLTVKHALHALMEEARR